MRLLTIIVLGLLIPGELYFLIGSIRIELYRVALIIAFFIVFSRINDAKPGKIEWLLLAYCGSFFISMLYNHGFGALEPTLILFLEVFVTFYVGRLATEYDLKNIKKFLSLFCYILILFIPFTIYEAKTGIRLFHVFSANVLGNPVVEKLSDSYIRMGIHRSSSVFAHPILYSVVTISFFPLMIRYFSGLQRAVLCSGFFVALLASVSSVGFLMLAAQFGLLLIEKINNIFTFFRKYLFIFIALFLSAVQVLTSQGALLFVISKISLNPHNAYYRYLQWSYAWDDVMRNSVFGTGSNSTWTKPWWMIDSVDSYWLSAFLLNGLYSTYILLGFWIAVIVTTYRYCMKTKDSELMAITFSVISLFLGSQTVDLFDRAHPISYLLLGMAVGIFRYKKKLYMENQ